MVEISTATLAFVGSLITAGTVLAGLAVLWGRITEKLTHVGTEMGKLGQKLDTLVEGHSQTHARLKVLEDRHERGNGAGATGQHPTIRS